MNNKISRTKIKLRLRKKTNPVLAETIALALKNKSWNNVARLLSSSNSLHSQVNLGKIDSETKVGDTALIPGKILSKGDLTKKIKLCALSISSQAHEKLKKTKSEFIAIKDEIEKNKKFEGVKIIR